MMWEIILLIVIIVSIIFVVWVISISADDPEIFKWHFRKMCKECGHHEKNHFGDTFFGFRICPKCGTDCRNHERWSFQQNTTIKTMRWHNEKWETK